MTAATATLAFSAGRQHCLVALQFKGLSSCTFTTLLQHLSIQLSSRPAHSRSVSIQQQEAAGVQLTPCYRVMSTQLNDRLRGGPLKAATCVLQTCVGYLYPEAHDTCKVKAQMWWGGRLCAQAASMAA
jgi:hypothetical protein